MPAFDLPAAFETSGPTKPIIFLLAPGEDPTELIFDFAQKKDIFSYLILLHKIIPLKLLHYVYITLLYHITVLSRILHYIK